MSHVYSSDFFDYIDAGVQTSAEALVGALYPMLATTSVVDFGCGRGLWLAQWSATGVEDIVGVDGDYVDRANLGIPEDKFRGLDLTMPIDLGRKFDLCQSLEVAEHLPGEASSTFIDTLVRHSDCVLFSAAVPGQGGEFHINERPMEFWRACFRERGYQPFDCIRPGLAGNPAVEPWYRYNTVLYANGAGAGRLPDDVLGTRVDEGVPLADFSSLPWKLRKAVVRHLPRPLVTEIAQRRAVLIANKARRKKAQQGLA
ncbi:methyltransferase domain-containing protein [Hoeflea prorocentri]|uniref:Methyltransferase domain-containing protein n=1 Tax=Hoeflea prorocentri TaxID=1922333 RepID=A0A9X3UG57_9HYPH|nr:hypothetical protein [Hoeflea prorocentri]MCY6380004.1 hypothetical protein [Hoeflea prorocentri]MDA5397804.1 hypothetical protein [Hoeflea prorocentri]